MLLGFVDRQGRAYDLNFRTLKRRLLDEAGAWGPEPGETLGAAVSLELAVFMGDERPHLLLRPTPGTLVASPKRLLFLAADSVERTSDEPTPFLVTVGVPRTAVDHLFLKAGGREIAEVRREDLRGTLQSRSELTLRVHARWVGGGDAPAPFLFVLRPLAAARAALAPLGV